MSSDILCQILGQFLCLQIPLKRTLMENRYDTGFFRYNHSHGIGLLSNTHG